MKKETFIDNPNNDYFGKNVDIVEYPKNELFDSSSYTKRIEYIKSFIDDNLPKLYLYIIKENRYYSIVTKLKDILNENYYKSVNLFVENVIFSNIISYFPKIWYKGKIYLEIVLNNIIYGYIRILYVEYDFIMNKEYNKYNTLLL